MAAVEGQDDGLTAGALLVVGVILMPAAPQLSPRLEGQGLVWGGGRCCMEQHGC